MFKYSEKAKKYPNLLIPQFVLTIMCNFKKGRFLKKFSQYLNLNLLGAVLCATESTKKLNKQFFMRMINQSLSF